MKTLLLSLLICAFASTLCFAQPAAPATKAPVPPVSAMKTTTSKVFVGKVESVSVADAAKGTKSEIVVLNEAGKKMTFLVKATTTFYEAAGVASTLDKVKAGEKVKIKFETSKEGVDEAKAVRLFQ